MIVGGKTSNQLDTVHYCLVIHKEHFAIVLYRVDELHPTFRMVKEVSYVVVEF